MLYSTYVLSIFVSYLMVKKTHYCNIIGNQKNTFIKKVENMNGISQSYFHNSITPLLFVDDKYIRTAFYMKKI